MTSVWRLCNLFFLEFYHHLGWRLFLLISSFHFAVVIRNSFLFYHLVAGEYSGYVHSTHWFHCSVFNEQFQDRQRRRKEIEVNTSFIRLLSSHYQSHFSFVQCNLPTRDVKVAWIWIHCCVRDSYRKIFTLFLFLEFL